VIRSESEAPAEQSEIPAPFSRFVILREAKDLFHLKFVILSEAKDLLFLARRACLRGVVPTSALNPEVLVPQSESVFSPRGRKNICLRLPRW